MHCGSLIARLANNFGDITMATVGSHTCVSCLEHAEPVGFPLPLGIACPFSLPLISHLVLKHRYRAASSSSAGTRCLPSRWLGLPTEAPPSPSPAREAWAGEGNLFLETPVFEFPTMSFQTRWRKKSHTRHYLQGALIMMCQGSAR